MDLLVSVITSGIVSGLVVFLSKGLVTQHFKKDFEKFKVELQTTQKLDIERKVHLYKEEQIKLNELWMMIVDLTEKYGALDPNKKDIETAIDNVEKYVVGNEIYLYEALLEKVKALLIKIETTEGKEDNLNEIHQLRKEIVHLIKVRIIFES
ncbi:hypothetical protein [Teredinibacter purpureus]|uniref:hypothetical protein n=1 Tax=Teredinibacter purpureus TaxID=2731756 RepID=UPI0005F87A8C|nr:hypothetical protein [Teredinibacter purpureus]